MMRKKKKRVAVTVKNPYKELALPFEGRRMLIRAEDIQDEQDDSHNGGLCPSEENNESGSLLSQESDIIYMNSECRSSKTANGVVTFKDEQGSKVNVRSSQNLNENLHDRKGMPLSQLSGDNSFMELSHTGVNHENTDKALDFFKMMQKVNSRHKRNNSKQTCKVKEPKSNEKTMSQNGHRCSCIHDDTFCLHTSDKSTHKREKHPSTSNTQLKSDYPRHFNWSNFTRQVPRQFSSCVNNSRECHELEEEEPVTGNLESCFKAGSSEARHTTEKSIPYQIHMNLTPEGRTNRYHVSRVKHFDDDNSSRYSYVIHVNCESDGDQNGSETEAQRNTKKRRGDITKRGIFIKEARKVGNAAENQHQPSECVSTELNKSGVYNLSNRFECPDSLDKIAEASVLECHNRSDKTAEISVPENYRRSDKTVETSVLCRDETSLERNKSKDISGKNKLTRRLIDHLQRKESLKEANQIQPVTPFHNTEILEADITQQVKQTSQNLIQKRDTRGNAKGGSYHRKQIELNADVARISVSEQRIHVRDDDKMVDGEAKQSDVLIGTNMEYNKKEWLKPMLDREAFSHDFASANVNENRKQATDIPNSEFTTSPSIDCQNRLTHNDNFESALHTSQEIENEHCCYSRTNSNHKWKDDTFANGLEEKRNTCLGGEFGRYDNGKTIKKGKPANCPSNKDDSVSLGSSVRLKTCPVLFKRILRPDATYKYKTSKDAGTEAKPFSFSYSTEHTDNIQLNEACSKNGKSKYTRTESPQRTIPYVKPITPLGRKNPFALESASNNSQHIIDASPQDTDEKTNRAVPQILKSLIQRHSPAMNIALQNENHSNRIKVNRESALYPSGTTKRKKHRSKVPRFRQRSPEADETGVTTFSELSKILHEARASSIIKCTAEKLHGSVHSPDSLSGVESCVNSSFMGEYLRCLWNNQMLCDVRVAVGDEEIFVHKLVLAAYSSVFCPPTPRPEPTLSFQIANSTPEAVRQLFSYMYTSNMALTDDLLEPVINAAIVMGIQEIVDIIKGILSSPTMDNVNLYATIIKRVGLDISLLDQEVVYREAFSDLRNNAVFLSISVEELEGILMDPEVMVTNEAETVEMIISWIQYNYLQRIGYLELLLRYVSFECIPPADLVMLSEKYNHIFDTNAGNSFLCKAFKFHALNAGFTCPSNDEKAQWVEIRRVEQDSKLVYQVSEGQNPQADISHTSQEAKRTADAAKASVNAYAPEEGLSALKVSLWGKELATESPQFVSAARTPVYGSNRSPQTVSRSTQHSPPTHTGSQSAPSTPLIRKKQTVPRSRYVSSRSTTPTPTPRYNEGRATPSRIIRGSRSPADYRSGQTPVYSGGESYASAGHTPAHVSPAPGRYSTLKSSHVTFNQPIRDSSEETTPTYQRNLGRNTNSLSYVSRNNNATDEALRFFLKRATSFKPLVTKTSIYAGDVNVTQSDLKYVSDDLGRSIDVRREQYHPAGHGRHQYRLTKHLVSKVTGESIEDIRATPDTFRADRQLSQANKTYREVVQCIKTNGDVVLGCVGNRDIVQGIVASREVSQDAKSNKVVHDIWASREVDQGVLNYKDLVRCTGDYQGSVGNRVVALINVANREVDQNNKANVDRCTITNREVDQDTRANRNVDRCTITNREVDQDTRANRNVDRCTITNREVDQDTRANRNVDRCTITNREVDQDTRANRNVDRCTITNREVDQDTRANRNGDRGNITNREPVGGTENDREDDEAVQAKIDSSQLSFATGDYHANDDSANSLQTSPEVPATLSFSLQEYAKAKYKEHATSNWQKQGHDEKQCVSTDQNNSQDSVITEKPEGKSILLQVPYTSNENYETLDKNTSEQSLFLLNHNAEFSAFEVYKPHI